MYVDLLKWIVKTLLTAIYFNTIPHILGNYEKQNFSLVAISLELSTLYNRARLIRGAENSL